MAETKKTTITVDDVDYVYEDMTQQQQTMVNHISDLDRKIGTSQFNLEQLSVGKSAFVNLLKESLTAPKEE
jgi:fibrillarin-like rRNA methylase